MKFFNKNLKKLIHIPALFIFSIIILFIFVSCSIFTGISERGSKDRDGSTGRLLPSFAGSSIEFVDTNSGDTYPGEDLMVYINIVNSGSMEAENVKVNLITRDYFISNGEETCWDIGILDAGGMKNYFSWIFKWFYCSILLFEY